LCCEQVNVSGWTETSHDSVDWLRCEQVSVSGWTETSHDVSSADKDDIMRTLLSHEKKSSAAAAAVGGGASTQSSSSDSDDDEFTSGTHIHTHTLSVN